MTSPAISIIVPCFKQAEYLPEALDSLIAQTFENWEAVVVNDGSPDHTEEIALAYAAKDPRIKYVTLENGGVARARNRGIAIARGEYILPLDADDTIAPTYLEKAKAALDNNPALKAVYCQAQLFGSQKGPWGVKYHDYKTLLVVNSIFVTTLFRKADAEAIGGFDEKMISGHEDWDFFIRLLGGDGHVYQIPETLFNYRIKNLSRNTEAVKRLSDTQYYLLDKNRALYQQFYPLPFNGIGGAEIMAAEAEALRSEVVKYRERRRNRWYKRLYRALLGKQ